MDEIKELEKLDSTFTESGFKSKVDNMYIMLLSSIIEGNMRPIQHKLSEEVYDKYCAFVDDLNTNNEIQLYDELNVKSTTIESINITDEKYIINVILVSRYMPYVIDKDTKKFKRGNNRERVQIVNHLVLTKRRDATDEGIVRKCSYCGAPVDINRNGICKYCNKPYNTESHDWILESIN